MRVLSAIRDSRSLLAMQQALHARTDALHRTRRDQAAVRGPWWLQSSGICPVQLAIGIDGARQARRAVALAHELVGDTHRRRQLPDLQARKDTELGIHDHLISRGHAMLGLLR